MSNTPQALVTADSIVSWLQSQVEQKLPVSPHVWLDAALKLSILLSDEKDKLIDMQQEVSQLKVLLIEAGSNATVARMKVEATNEYRDMNKQRAKVEGIVEFIRIAKLRSKLEGDEIRSQF